LWHDCLKETCLFILSLRFSHIYFIIFYGINKVVEFNIKNIKINETLRIILYKKSSLNVRILKRLIPYLFILDKLWIIFVIIVDVTEVVGKCIIVTVDRF
jgi:hypothetical protein